MKNKLIALLLCLTFVTPIAAIDFDGVDDYISLATGSVQDEAEVTIACWVNFASLAATVNVYLESTDSDTNARFNLAVKSGGQIRLAGRATDTFSFTEFSVGNASTVSTGAWVHIAGVYDATTTNHKVYVDGVDDTFAVAGGSSAFSSGNPIAIRIGANLTDSVFYDIIIDDLRIYDRVLSADEVAALYAAGRKRSNKQIGGTLAQGLVGHWLMTDGPVGADASGTANILDSSGNGNHGDGVDGADGSLVFTAPATN